MSKPNCTYIYMVPYYWGKGDTVQEAIDNCGGDFSDEGSLFLIPSKTEVYVDGMGSIHWTKEEGPFKEMDSIEMGRYTRKGESCVDALVKTLFDYDGRTCCHENFKSDFEENGMLGFYNEWFGEDENYDT